MSDSERNSRVNHCHFYFEHYSDDKKCTATRYVKGKTDKIAIDCPPVVKDYAINMNGVEKADRDGRDNSVTIRSNRWYLRILFWTIERAVHCAYIVVCYCDETGLREDGGLVNAIFAFFAKKG